VTTQITIPASHFATAETPQLTTFARQPSFTQKLLNFAVTLDPTANGQPNSFAELNGLPTSGTFNISGARARCRITNAGAPAGGMADITIYGLSLSLMNQLATLGVVVDSVSKNQIIVSAGASSLPDASSANAAQTPAGGFPVVFGGTIWFAYGDYSNMPETPIRIIAQAGLINAVKSAAPASYTGPTSIVSIMESFAQQLGVPLENNGVDGTLASPYFPGTVLQQVYQAAEHANIRALLVDGGTKLAIMPKNGSRTSLTNIPLISKNSGMVGSPSFAQNGWLVVKMVYNPDVAFLGNIQVESAVVPQANKTWTVFKLDLALDTLLPDGDWMATALCYPKGVNAPAPPAVTQ
jgi:hypothetical protein